MGHGTTAVTTTPAINQRFPVAGFVCHCVLQVQRNVFGDQRSTDFFRFERTVMFVDSTHLRTLTVTQHGTIDRAWHVIEGELRLGAHVNDAVVVGQMREYVAGGQQCGIFHERILAQHGFQDLPDVFHHDGLSTLVGMNTVGLKK